MNVREQSDRIQLIVATEEHLNRIYEMEWAPENSHFVMPWSMERHIQSLSEPDEIQFVIWDNEAQVMVGFIILAGLKNYYKSIELRRIVVKVKGKGYGRLAITKALNFCFKHRRAHRVWLDVFDDNASAKGLYESIGFKTEGLLRDSFWNGENYKSQFIMSVLEGEWLQG